MFKVLVHGSHEARCKPLIHVIQTSNRSLIFTQELAFLRNEGGFPSENHSGQSSSLLQTSLKLSTTPLCRMLARFQQTLVVLSGPGAVQLRFLDRTLTASATSRAIRRLLVVVLAHGSRSLLHATRPRSYSQSLSLPTAFSKTRSPLQCFQTFANHLEHVF